MPNYFLDNSDIQFHFRNFDIKEIVSLQKTIMRNRSFIITLLSIMKMRWKTIKEFLR